LTAENNILNIVLVEPQIPQNTGNIARTCAVTGARLHIVGPAGFVVDDTKLKRAGLDYWHMLDITWYDGLEHFSLKIPENIIFSAQKHPKGILMLFIPTTAISFLGVRMPDFRKRFCRRI